MAALTLKELYKSFNGAPAVAGVSLDVKDREFVAFVGPSGCGKTTLLRMIAGLEDITSGELLIDGKRMNEVGPAKRGVAMVFQSYALYPHMTVAQNMGFALKLAGMKPAERDAKILEAARILQLEPLLDRKPAQLSGGQRQRAAIGRAIVRNPGIFLFDEPLSNLDASLRGQMRLELARLHGQLGATMIYVTHDQVEAMTMADKIVVLRAGKVEQVGSPLELYRRPANSFVAGFIGSPRMNMLEVEVMGTDATGVAVRGAGGLALTAPVRADGVVAGQTVTLGVRPEHLVLDMKGALTGQLLHAERLGHVSFLHVRLADGAVVTAQGEGADLSAPGQTVALALAAAHGHLFGADGVALQPLTP